MKAQLAIISVALSLFIIPRRRRKHLRYENVHHSSSSPPVLSLPSPPLVVLENDEKRFLQNAILNCNLAQSICIGDHLGIYVAILEAQTCSPSGTATLEEICIRSQTDPGRTEEWLMFQVLAIWLF